MKAVRRRSSIPDVRAASRVGRPTIAYIDTAALRGNLAEVRTLAPGLPVLAVVKADGYGHGALLVARELADAGAEWFGVATVDEAIELRAGGIRKPILVLAGASAEDVEALIEHRLRVAILDADMARSLAGRPGRWRIPVHVKLDSGMGRLGVRPETLPELIEVLKQRPQLIVEGLFSHFADADDASGESTRRQILVFRQGLETMRAAGLGVEWFHQANSIASLTCPEARGNLVRPGIALYGIRPAAAPAEVRLRPVMHLRTRIWQLKTVPAGCPLSYGATFVTRRESRIAVLPIGYADGYARALSNRGEVLVRGQRAPVVGRVTMDVTLIDVTDVRAAAPGDEVVLWGRQGDAALTVGEVAAWQDSIPYEVLVRVGKRVPRVAMDAATADGDG